MDITKFDDKKRLFDYLDNLRKRDIKAYAHILKEHEQDLYDCGYLKHTKTDET